MIILQILKEDIRQRIIEIGRKHFEKNGFENTSMKDIASDVGISTGNIYRYFLTKKHLLGEILLELEKEIEDFFVSIPSNYEEVKLANIFDLIIDFTLKVSKEHNDTLKIMFKSQNEAQFIAFKEKILDLFTSKMNEIVLSINKNNNHANLCEAIARAQFEGFTCIVRNNLDDTKMMKKNLELYKKLMIEDLGLKVIEVIKK